MLWAVAASTPAFSAGYKTVAPWVGQTQEGIVCQGRPQGYGPFDYTQRATNMQSLKIVEDYHFTSNVESLIKGANGSIPSDIDYTLSAWPNHHRALNSISRYDLGYPNKRHKPAQPIECYFNRAILFSPDDSITQLLYAIYLHKSGHQARALELYQSAEKLAPTDPQIQYNMALLLVDMKDFEKARYYADSVYARGYPLPGLKRRLTAAGYWDEGTDKLDSGAETK